MAWESALLSENQNDLDACHAGGEDQPNILAVATGDFNSSRLLGSIPFRGWQSKKSNGVNDGFEDIVGQSEALREVLELSELWRQQIPLPLSKEKPGPGRNSSRAPFMNTARAAIAPS